MIKPRDYVSLLYCHDVAIMCHYSTNDDSSVGARDDLCSCCVTQLCDNVEQMLGGTPGILGLGWEMVLCNLDLLLSTNKYSLCVFPVLINNK